MNVNYLVKFVRTPHLQGSLRTGDDAELDFVPFLDIAGKHVVVSTKADGSNVGLSFDSSANLLLQSRGHYLAGHDKPHYDLFKAWAKHKEDALFDSIADRYILYGEWLGTLHSVFYDRLPHYFLAFDAWDKQEGFFLSTPKAKELLTGTGVVWVNRVASGAFDNTYDLLKCLYRDPFVSYGATSVLEEEMAKAGYPEQVRAALRKINRNGTMEGLYVKVEENGKVVSRCKYVRKNFRDGITESDLHWNDRPAIHNRLADGVDIFG